MAPDGANDEMKFAALEPGVGGPEVVALHDERQGTLVHVKHHNELVWYL